jgi:hypothetical protein
MGTGGYRYGAGRPGWRRKCEQSLPLDIRRLKAKGLLRPGQWFRWTWSADGERVGDIGVSVGSHHLELTYRWTPYGSPARDIRCDVPFAWTPCHFGGSRQWFACPRCGRRCAVIYMGGGEFACRTCLRLGYISESLDTVNRLWRKQSKLEVRLGPDGGKPKRMRKRTYERIWARIDAVEEARDAAWWTGFARLAVRLGADPTSLMAELRDD